MDVAGAESVFRAYREGLLSPISERVRLTSRTFDFQISCALTNLVPLQDRRRFSASGVARSQGLLLARKGQLAEAAQHFETGRVLLSDRNWNRLAWLLAFTFHETAEAYLDARNLAFDQALSRLFASMDANVEIEEGFGLGFLQGHRIQSVHNIARLCWKLDRVGEGASHCGNIIAFLEGRSARLPIHRSWSQRRLFHMSKVHRRAMISQVIDETAFHLARSPTEENWDALLRSSRLEEPSCFKWAFHPQVDLWMRAEKARMEGRVEAYLQFLSQFLRHGRHEIATTWYLAVASFAAFCEWDGSTVALYVRDAIVRDSAKWPSVPLPITAFLKMEPLLAFREDPPNHGASAPDQEM